MRIPLFLPGVLRALLALLAGALLFAPLGCAHRRVIDHGVGPDDPVTAVGAAARFLIERPAAPVAAGSPVVVRLFRRGGNSFDHDYEFRFDREGEFLIERLPPDDYDVEAFVDLNGTREPEVGLDAVAGRLAAPYDPAANGRARLREGEMARIDLRLLDPLPGGLPAPGETGVGSYASFAWIPLPAALQYEFRVRDDAGEDLYRVREVEPRAVYGRVPPPEQGTLLKFPSPLRHGTYYRWSVVALGPEGRVVGYLAARRFVP